MVPTINIVMLVVVGLACLAIPIGGLLWVRKKSKRVTGAFFAGVLSFVVMQVIIRIPIMQYVMPNVKWYVNLPENNFFLFALLVGFTAALFETVGRYLSIKLLLKNRLSYYSGISHGIGHGGIEMVVIISLSYVSLLVYAVLINTGGFDQMLEGLVQGAGAQADVVRAQLLSVQDSLLNSAPSDFLLALFERVCTLFIHIGLSVMVMEGIVRKKGMLFSLFALAIHTTIDTGAVLLVNAGMNMLLVEAIVMVVAIGLVVYVLMSKKRFGENVHSKDKDEKLLEADY